MMEPSPFVQSLALLSSLAGGGAPGGLGCSARGGLGTPGLPTT